LAAALILICRTIGVSDSFSKMYSLGDPDVKGNCVRLKYADTIALIGLARKVCSPAPYVHLNLSAHHVLASPSGLVDFAGRIRISCTFTAKS